MSIDDTSIPTAGPDYLTASYPLPDDHWIYSDTVCRNPPERSGEVTLFDTQTWCELTPAEAHAYVTDAIKYGLKGASLNGHAFSDMDPDAVVQNITYALLGPRKPTSVTTDE